MFYKIVFVIAEIFLKFFYAVKTAELTTSIRLNRQQFYLNYTKFYQRAIKIHEAYFIYYVLFLHTGLRVRLPSSLPTEDVSRNSASCHC